MSSNACAEPLPRIKIYFFLLSICTDEPILTTNIMTVLPVLPSGNENPELESNPIL